MGNELFTSGGPVTALLRRLVDEREAACDDWDGRTQRTEPDARGRFDAIDFIGWIDFSPSVFDFCWLLAEIEKRDKRLEELERHVRELAMGCRRG